MNPTSATAPAALTRGLREVGAGRCLILVTRDGQKLTRRVAGGQACPQPLRSPVQRPRQPPPVSRHAVHFCLDTAATRRELNVFGALSRPVLWQRPVKRARSQGHGLKLWKLRQSASH